jgi:hypothetical protein
MHKIVNIRLVLAFVVLMAALVLILRPQRTCASSWLSGYAYRQTINLSHPSGAVTNYQMPLTVNKTGTSSGSTCGLNGHAQSWTGTVPNDIRFTNSDGTTQLSYWIQSSTPTTAQVWIKFDSIGTSSTSFYVYYGKDSDATTSSGTDTFISFFDCSSLTGWTNSTQPVTVNSGTGNPVPSFKSTVNQYAYKDIGLTTNEILEFDGNVISGRTDLCNFYFLANSAGLGQMFRLEGRETGNGKL